jgi:hypothetical protein
MYGYNPYGYPQFGAQMALNGFVPSGMNNYTQTGGVSQNSPQGGMEVVPVQTIQQVEQVGVQPGQRKLVLVQNEPVIAARSADNMGLTTTEFYRLEKYDPHAVQAPAPEAEYVTRREFEEFVATLKPATSKKKEAAE